MENCQGRDRWAILALRFVFAGAGFDVALSNINSTS
jgi:hypothetical protein